MVNCQQSIDNDETPMTIFEIIAILTTLAALFAWLNYRVLRLPTTIGLMIIAMLTSLLLAALGRMGFVVGPFVELVSAIDFDQALLHGLLGALLFAGALHLDLEELWGQLGIIITLATVGVLISTFLVGAGTWLLLSLAGLSLPFVWCLLFGALISPTDPIAVGAILRKAGVPRSLEIKIAGESLFNDGVGVVIFLAVAGLALGGQSVTGATVAKLFAVEVGGGLLFGAAIGWLAYRMLKSVDNYQVEILITLALVTGGFALADRLHISGPLAMVVAGLLIGNRGRRLAMSETTRARLDEFWELVDEFLNAVLFVLIGVEIVVVDATPAVLLVAVGVIPLLLLARLVSVGLPVGLLRRSRPFSPNAVRVLTWSGLRGGISVALALSLPAGSERNLLVAVTYVAVAFSIIVQGLTVGPVTRRLFARGGAPAAADTAL
jgi:monovalent cation:H+ antiporter, CPA1 family